MWALRNINWSEVVREAILRRLELEEKRNLAKAVLLNEELRREAPKDWNSVEVIRFWREHRYGAGDLDSSNTKQLGKVSW